MKPKWIHQLINKRKTCLTKFLFITMFFHFVFVLIHRFPGDHCENAVCMISISHLTVSLCFSVVEGDANPTSCAVLSIWHQLTTWRQIFKLCWSFNKTNKQINLSIRCTVLHATVLRYFISRACCKHCCFYFYYIGMMLWPVSIFVMIQSVTTAKANFCFNI